MKTYKNLYPKLCSYKNIRKAFMKARKNKTSKFYVKLFQENLEENLQEIKRELESQTYQPFPWVFCRDVGRVQKRKSF